LRAEVQRLMTASGCSDACGSPFVGKFAIANVSHIAVALRRFDYAWQHLSPSVAASALIIIISLHCTHKYIEIHGETSSTTLEERQLMPLAGNESSPHQAPLHSQIQIVDFSTRAPLDVRNDLVMLSAYLYTQYCISDPRPQVKTNIPWR
jgi:hypothetical protein